MEKQYIEKVNNNHIFSSKEVIGMVLEKIGLTRDSKSTYQQYKYPNGEFLRLRVSDHGIYLQHWYDKNRKARMDGQNIPHLNDGLNLAITFAPNEEECQAMGETFPMKIKNITDAKTENGNNVKPQFTVRHICYNTWELTQEEVDSIIESLRKCVSDGTNYIEPLGEDSSKVSEWEDTSNLLPRRRQGEKLEQSREKNNDEKIKKEQYMNKKLIRLTESDLHRIVRESVNKVLNEIGDTERGQYALGAVQARADMRKRNALNDKNFGERGDRDTYNRNDNISGDASKSAFKYNYTGDMDANYDKRKDLYNANQRGYRNYMSYMNGAGNIDYKTAPQTRNEVGY